MQVLEKVAKAVSRNYGIKVVFKGKQAHTDGRTIVLPTLPVDLDETDEAKVRGYCDHEIGHIVFTDMKAYEAYAKQGKRQADVLNLVEDLWIEKHLGIKYPGAKVNMEKTAQTLHAEAVRKMGMKMANEHILARIWVEGRRQNAGFGFPDPDMTADIKKVFGDDFFKRLAAVDSTKKAVALAKHIVKLADTPMPKSDGGSDNGGDSNPGKGADDPKESDSGACRSSETKGEKEIKDENEGEVGDGGADNDDSEEAGDSNDSTDEDGNGDENDGAEAEDDGDGGDMSCDEDSEEDNEACNSGMGGTESDEKAGDLAGRGSGEADDVDSPDDSGTLEDAYDVETGEGDIASEKPVEGDENPSTAAAEEYEPRADLEGFEDELEKLKEELERLHEKSLASGEYMVLDTSKDTIEPVKEADNTSAYKALKDELGSLNTIKAKISNLFNTKVAGKWLYDREAGKINSRALAKVKHGCQNVFKVKHMSRETDTAISFLVDFSGSMSGGRLRMAMMAVVLFLETLQATRIKSEVLGYTTGSNLAPSGMDWDELCKYGRIEALKTYVIKDFNESFGNKIKRRISNWVRIGLKENCDPESVKIAYERLKARPERRKILFVLSDGNVANLGNCTVGMDYYKKLAKQIEREGIVEPVGIGLHSRSIKKYFTNCIFVEGRSADLAKELSDQLTL